MTRRRPRVAHRTIPVAVAVPVQLPLGLKWSDPIDRVAIEREPSPVAPVVALRKVAA